MKCCSLSIQPIGKSLLATQFPVQCNTRCLHSNKSGRPAGSWPQQKRHFLPLASLTRSSRCVNSIRNSNYTQNQGCQHRLPQYKREPYSHLCVQVIICHPFTDEQSEFGQSRDIATVRPRKRQINGQISQIRYTVALEPEGSSPHSQQPATGPCPETVESNPHPPRQSL
jgi:hypothetical protein